MSTIYLYINGQLADTSGAVRVVLERVVNDYRNPLKKTGEYSYSIKLPKSGVNKRLFGHEDDLAVLGKFRRTYDAYIEVDGVRLITGTFKHRSNEPEYFVGNITGTVATKIGSLLDPEKTLRDIRSFEKLTFQAATTLAESLNNADLFWASENPAGSADWREVVYPYVVDSFARLNDLSRTIVATTNADYTPRTYENHGVSHFVGAIVKRMFEDVGYSIAGDVLDTPAFRKLVLLYSNQDGQAAPYNYGTLAPMRSTCAVSGPFGGAFVGANIGRETLRVTDRVLALTYPFSAESGDLAECLGRDGVYTPKYTGVYKVLIRAQAVVNHRSGNPVLTHEGFTCLRCISDDEFIPELLLPGVGQFATATAQYLDAGTLVVGDGGPFTVRLEAGKQYAVQRYISLANNSGYNPSTHNVYNDAAGAFSITACDGALQLDPAKFLPDMKQVDFLRGVLKLFNLYPVVDSASATVTFYTRDAFFALTATSLLDLTDRCDPRTFTERPFTDSEAAEMALRYTDDGDFLSKRTDLLEQANASAPENAYELPFAPLGFVETKLYDVGDGSYSRVGTDLTPCILPDADPVNSSLISDYGNEYLHGYKPRIALYEAGAVKDGLTGGYAYAGGGWFGGIFGDGTYVPIPAGIGYTARLTFFGTSGRKYKLVEDAALRTLALVPSTDPDIYTTGDPDFLRDPPNLTDASLAIDLADPAAFYGELYRSEQRTMAHSHYVEGQVRIDGALYNRLDGRGVIRIGTGYYLLSGVSGYDVSADAATIQLYVHVQ